MVTAAVYRRQDGGLVGLRSWLSLALSAVGLTVLVGALWRWRRWQRQEMTTRLDPIKAMVRRSFPDVTSMTTAELAASVERGAPLVLLDVRTAEEYRVSHLAGAIRVDPGAPVLDLELDPAAEVVAYCSVGWRSARLARRLAAAGVRVVNLEGSIFEWVAQGRPVVDDRGLPVRAVHPFSRSWAWLVDPPLRRFD